MPQMTFAYKVRDGDGKLIEGTLDGDNQGLVASRLRQMGYTPINIEAKNAKGINKELHIPGHGEPDRAEGNSYLQPAVRHAHSCGPHADQVIGDTHRPNRERQPWQR